MAGASTHGDTVLMTSLFVAIEASFAYSAKMPSWFTVSTFSDDPEKVAVLRQGEVAATAWALALAIVSSILLQSVWPLAFAIVACGAEVIGYEYQIAHPVGDVHSMTEGASS